MNTFKNEFQVIQNLYETQALPRLNTLKEISTTRPIILYGAGATGDLTADLYLELGIRVECFCDSYAKGIHKNGLRIISPDEMKANYPNSMIVITGVAFYDAIYKYLRSLEFTDEQITRTPALYSYKTIEPHLNGYEWAYDFFTDAASKAIILQRLESFLLATPCPYSLPTEMYFEQTLIRLSDNEVFVDCGAFTGDTVEDFIKRVNSYKHIYAFEPEAQNGVIIEKNLSLYPNITVIHKGVWDVETELRFSAGNSIASRLEDSGTTIIPVTTIDNIFSGNQLSDMPTFIKMDIEGAEFEALSGAKHIIELARPKLAICIYHKIEDIYKLTQLIHSFRSDYKFALRQYRVSVFDTVLYAV